LSHRGRDFCVACHPAALSPALRAPDKDSTASLTGQPLGTLADPQVIPNAWLHQLVLREVIEAIATNLVTALAEVDSLQSRYPGW
jgi:hypothetical protein